MKKEMAIWVHRFPTRLTKGGWEYEERRHEVRVMARVEGYAMVRRIGAVPIVVSEKTLEAIP